MMRCLLPLVLSAICCSTALAAAAPAQELKRDAISALGTSNSIVWGFVDTSGIFFVRAETVPFTLQGSTKPAGTIKTYVPERQLAFLRGLLSRAAGGVGSPKIKITLTGDGNGTFPGITTELRAGGGMTPFVLVVPPGEYKLTIDVDIPELKYRAVAPKSLAVPSEQQALYVGDLEMVVLDGSEHSLHDYGDFSKRQREFSRKNRNFNRPVTAMRPCQVLMRGK